jgi:hypothetical protein
LDFSIPFHIVGNTKNLTHVIDLSHTGQSMVHKVTAVQAKYLFTTNIFVRASLSESKSKWLLSFTISVDIHESEGNDTISERFVNVFDLKS